MDRCSLAAKRASGVSAKLRWMNGSIALERNDPSGGTKYTESAPLQEEVRARPAAAKPAAAATSAAPSQSKAWGDARTPTARSTAEAATYAAAAARADGPERGRSGRAKR